MKKFTLLPIKSGKNTGKLYDDPNKASVVLDAKVFWRWSDRDASEIKRLIQIRLWTTEANCWTEIMLDADTHAVLAVASALRERDAFERLEKQIKLKLDLELGESTNGNYSAWL